MALPAEVAKVLCPCADCSEQRPPLTVFLKERCLANHAAHGSPDMKTPYPDLRSYTKKQDYKVA